jgi:hypothetical protein
MALSFTYFSPNLFTFHSLSSYQVALMALVTKERLLLVFIQLKLPVNFRRVTSQENQTFSRLAATALVKVLVFMRPVDTIEIARIW